MMGHWFVVHRVALLIFLKISCGTRGGIQELPKQPPSEGKQQKRARRFYRTIRCMNLESLTSASSERQDWDDSRGIRSEDILCTPRPTTIDSGTAERARAPFCFPIECNNHRSPPDFQLCARTSRRQWLRESETIVNEEHKLLFCAPPNTGSLQFRMLAKRMQVNFLSTYTKIIGSKGH